MNSLDTALQRVMVTDRRRLGGAAFGEAVAAGAAGSAASLILVREKDLDDAELTVVVRELLERVRIPVAVAHRPEVAGATRAWGVHLGWTSPSVAEARAVLEPAMRIGASVHDLDAAQHCAAAGADYLFFGPVKPTPKNFGTVTPRGFELLARVVAAVNVPVVAIGGLGPQDADRVAAAGAVGYAGIRSFLRDRKAER